MFFALSILKTKNNEIKCREEKKNTKFRRRILRVEEKKRLRSVKEKEYKV